jgi:hypothetical protein
MEESEKWLKLTFKLLEATQTGEIKWHRIGDGSRPVYETAFMGQQLRIAERRDETVVLLFIDALGSITYEAPPTEGLPHLLTAIKRETAGVDAFLDKVLALTP